MAFVSVLGLFVMYFIMIVLNACTWHFAVQTSKSGLSFICQTYIVDCQALTFSSFEAVKYTR